MNRLLFHSALGASVLAAAIGQAAETDFEDRVRAFILENPEVIVEALGILAEREARAAIVLRLEEFPELFSDAPKLGEGDPGADVRVIEFFDYKCGPCKAIHPQLLDFVEANPSVRIEMRHLPILTPGSERAARFALATEAIHGAEAHRAVHSRLWDMRGPLNAAGFKRVADALGLDYTQIEAAMEDEAIDARISYNRDAAIALEILGTPAFVTPDSVVFGIADIEAMAELWLSQ